MCLHWLFYGLVAFDIRSSTPFPPETPEALPTHAGPCSKIRRLRLDLQGMASGLGVWLFKERGFQGV